MTLELDYDRSILGKEYNTGPFHVSADLIRDYCRALGETNPIYTDEEAAKKAGHAGLVAPPALCSVFVRQVTTPDIKLNFGTLRFHAGQMVAPEADIIAGDSLSASTFLKEVYPKTGRTGTMVFMVWETVFTNQRGERVADVQESFAARE